VDAVYSPAAQLTQAVVVAVVAAYLPAAQLEQLVAPADAMNLPAAQFMHAVDIDAAEVAK